MALGFNYCLTDLQAALGFSQITRLGQYVERRNILAGRYDQLLDGLPLQRSLVRTGNRSAFHLYAVRLHTETIGKTHLEIFEAMRDRGVGVNLDYMPVHLQPYYRKLGFAPRMCPVAEHYGRQAISLPLYSSLGEADQSHLAESLRACLS